MASTRQDSRNAGRPGATSPHPLWRVTAVAVSVVALTLVIVRVSGSHAHATVRVAQDGDPHQISDSHETANEQLSSDEGTAADSPIAKDATVASRSVDAASTGDEPAEVPANGIAPDQSPLCLEPPVLDFGPVQKGTRAEGIVRLLNAADRPLRVLRATSSCGCTVADVPKTAIEPGEFATATITFRPGGRVGRKSTKHVTFIPEGDLPPARLEVSATVAELVTVEVIPDAADLATPASVRVAAADGQPFRVTAVQPAGVIAEFPSETALEHVLPLGSSASPAELPTRLRLTLDHPAVGSLTIPLKNSAGDHRGGSSTPTGASATLQVRPRRVDFGTLPAGEVVVREVIINDLSLQDAEQLKISCESPLITAAILSSEHRQEALMLQIGLSASSDSLGRVRARVAVAHGHMRGSFTAYVQIVAPPQTRRVSY